MARAGLLILALAAIPALGLAVWAVVRSGDRPTPAHLVETEGGNDDGAAR